MAGDAFQTAIVPTARLLAEHITRDVIAKKLGWTDLEFVFSDLDGEKLRASIRRCRKLFELCDATPCGLSVMTDFEKQVLEDLAELKTDMRWVAGGDSHPGRLQELAVQVEKHEAFLQRARGLSAAMPCLFTIVYLGIDYLRMHVGR